jgi:hypothetical protein
MIYMDLHITGYISPPIRTGTQNSFICNNKHELLLMDDGWLLGCCAVWYGRSLPTFHRCLLPPSWGPCNIPEVSHLHRRHSENLKSHLLLTEFIRLHFIFRCQILFACSFVWYNDLHGLLMESVWLAFHIQISHSFASFLTAPMHLNLLTCYVMFVSNAIYTFTLLMQWNVMTCTDLFVIEFMPYTGIFRLLLTLTLIVILYALVTV